MRFSQTSTGRRRRSIASMFLASYRILLDNDAELGGGGAELGGGLGGASATPDESSFQQANGGDREANFGGDIDVPDATAATESTAALVPGDPNQAAALRPAAPAAAAPQWQGIRDVAAAEFGYKFGPDVTNDREALIALVRAAEAAKQVNVHAQLGQQLAPHAPKIQEFLAQQGKPAAPVVNAWDPPEFDKRWGSLVDQNEATGLFVAKPGVDPAIAQKVNTYVEWKSKYDENPAAMISQLVESKARDIATKIYAEQNATNQRTSTINQIANANAPWVYQAGADGRPLVNPITGQYQVSPAGASYMRHLQSVRSMGVVDPTYQDQLARQLVRSEFSQAPAAPAAAVQATFAQAPASINPLGTQTSTQRHNQPAAPAESTAGLSLHEQLARAMAAEGVKDEDFAGAGF